MTGITAFAVSVCILCIVLFAYIIRIKKELCNIKGQLHRRNTENTKNELLTEMADKDIREMLAEMNKVLLCDEKSQISARNREREFKELIANISHDLRTPLTVIKGYIQLLEKCNIDSEGREYLSVCGENTDKLEGLISEFFEYSYWISEENIVVCEIINLNVIIENIMADFVPMLEEKGLTMRLDISGVYKVSGEKVILQRILGNIFKNCLLYAEGEVEVKVVKKDIKIVKVSVSNRLKKDSRLDINRIFQRFYTGDSARNVSTGLGLSIVKVLVEKMGGEVCAEITDGRFEIGFTLLSAS